MRPCDTGDLARTRCRVGALTQSPSRYSRAGAPNAAPNAVDYRLDLRRRGRCQNTQPAGVVEVSNTLAQRPSASDCISRSFRLPSMRSFLRPFLLAASAALVVGCASARPAQPNFVPGLEGAILRARADSLRYPYTEADIGFMRDMIHHHAQAIVMSKWTDSHGADAAVVRLSKRIINAQTDEITIMRHWLEDRNQVPPTVDSMGNVSMGTASATADPHAGHNMPAHNMPGHDMSSMPAMASMPGMLTAAQMAELNAARGSEFDRLYLTFMMQHHQGAVAMVKELFTSPGAGQDETIFKFANDVEVDQSTEIRRMLTMMLELGFAPPLG